MEAIDWNSCIVCSKHSGNLKCPVDSYEYNGLEVYKNFLGIVEEFHSLPGFSSPLSYVFWRMRLAVQKKWQIQVRSGNCVCPIMMDDCKCGKTITHCIVVTPLSPVNGPSVSRFLVHAQL